MHRRWESELTRSDRLRRLMAAVVLLCTMQAAPPLLAQPANTAAPGAAPGAAAGAAVTGLGGEPYPVRPITMVVAFPPGGVADLTARPIAVPLERILRQRVLIETRAGAGGAIGNAYVARAKPDGYTLLMALSSLSILPEADKVNGRTPAYSLDQFAPIALISSDPTILVVRSESPLKSVRELLDAARAQPGKLNYSSSGLYSALHTPMEMLALAGDVKLFHVPYQGGAPAVTALLGGQVELLASGPGPVLPHIKAGKLRALASWGGRRHPALPDVPTLKELGIDAEFYIWAGLYAPAGTPEPVVRRLREAVREAVQDAQFRAGMEAAGQPLDYRDAPEFRSFWETDAKKMADIVRRIGRLEEKK
jgi:tripartite-type tricarboxylate transporter receptor subunit TctC